MPYDPRFHHRRSIRLKGYDYAQAGAYFITLCAHRRARIFGAVVDGAMQLNDAGRAAAQCWRDIPAHFPHVALDAFVIMPNHVHGILWIIGNDDTGDAGTAADTTGMDDVAGTDGDGIVGAKDLSPLRFPYSPHQQPHLPQQHPSPFASSPPYPPVRPRGTSRTIGSVVRGFKIGVTKWFRQNAFTGAVWQRNYYERIIRDERALHAIRRYITENPQRWHLDRENDRRIGSDPLAREIWDMLQSNDRELDTGGVQ